jgi:hypothetical protein
VTESKLTESQIRARMNEVMWARDEVDHDFSMELRYLAERKYGSFDSEGIFQGQRDPQMRPLLNLALLLELNDERAEAKPADYAREYLELLGPPDG